MSKNTKMAASQDIMTGVKQVTLMRDGEGTTLILDLEEGVQVGVRVGEGTFKRMQAAFTHVHVVRKNV